MEAVNGHTTGAPVTVVFVDSGADSLALVVRMRLVLCEAMPDSVVTLHASSPVTRPGKC